MTFNFKCGCGKELQVMAETVQDVNATLKAQNWRLNLAIPIPEFPGDNLPSICPSCDPTCREEL